MTQDLQYVGQTYPVHDAAQKVTGELEYGSDIELHGMLYAKLLLSPIPHGMVTSIDSRAAEALPGVVKVFSHRNSPAEAYCRAGSRRSRSSARGTRHCSASTCALSATASRRS